MASCQGDWECKVTAIEFEEKPFYFTTVRANPAMVIRPLGGGPRQFPEILTSPRILTSCTLTVPRAVHHFNRAEYSIKLSEVERDLLSTFGTSGMIWQLHHHVKRNVDSYTRGFYIQVFEIGHLNGTAGSCKETLVQFGRERALKVAFLDFHQASDTVWETTVFEDEGGATSQQQVSRLVRPEPVPKCHPAFLRSENNSVFNCLRDVWNVLEKCPDLPGVSELKQIAIEELGDWLTAVLPDVTYETCHAQPFIVVEGLDGTGKSTLVQRLADILKPRQSHIMKLDVLDAHVMKTPPDCLMKLRPLFDRYPSLIRRLYYSIGNYIVGKQIREMCKSCPVIMDRFWNSTAAYTIASECPGGDASVLPSRGHDVYHWPADLVQPTIVLLLTLNEEERQARLSHREKTESAPTSLEEQWLARNKVHPKRVVEAYRRMTHPSPVEVPADCSKDDLVQRALDCIYAGRWNPVLEFVKM